MGNWYHLKTFGFLTPAKRETHGLIILLCTGILLLSLLLRVQDSGAVYIPSLEKYPLPESCIVKQISGTECPTCGLTRSFIAIGHSHFTAAWHFNRVGIFVYLYVILQASYQAFILWKWKIQRCCQALIQFGTYAIATALVINWLYNLVAGSLL